VIIHTEAEGDTSDFGGGEVIDLSATAQRMQNRDANGNVAQRFEFPANSPRFFYQVSRP